MWADKPILFYWFMSVPVRLLGPTEFACRFWGGVGAAVTSLLTFFIGQRLLGAKAGLWAMIVLASTLEMIGVGTLATIDAVLLPFIVAVVAIFVQSAISRIRIWHIILAGIALGAGMLPRTDGPATHRSNSGNFVAWPQSRAGSPAICLAIRSGINHRRFDISGMGDTSQ